MSLPEITIWSQQDSPRLRYVLDWLFKQQLGFTYQLVTDEIAAALANNCIAYGYLPDKISIVASGLLFEQDVKPHTIECNNWNALPTFYHDKQSTTTLPFDLFAGIFYNLTRYEEYFSHPNDKHGRYPATESILSKENLLERPFLDEWVSYFRQLLAHQWQISIPAKPFRFLPTYDIDIAWSFLHKGVKRILGAASKDILKGNFKSFASRFQVLAGNAQDPYDAYLWMKQLHERYNLAPHYFVLAALEDSPFDKNIHPAHPAMQQLIISLKSEGPVGMHPSYFTDSASAKFLAEKRTLEEITEGPILTSRQHYIRLFLPATYRKLIAAGIQDDYSMGYSTALGFRAGTSQSFYWYDLEKETATTLNVHPFCFMDTTAHYDLDLSVTESFERLRQMTDRLINCDGTLTTILHNFSLGSDAEWNGWKVGYEQLIQGLPK